MALSAASIFVSIGKVWVRFNGWVYRAREPRAFWGEVAACYFAGVCFIGFFFLWPAPSPDWNGTWKLNPAKSIYEGQVLTIAVSADDEYRFDESASHIIRCDGKERSTGNDRTVLCVKNALTALDITLKENGAKTRFTHDQLSTDGATFTTTVTEFRPDGHAVTFPITFSRLSGSNGFAGQWRDTSYFQRRADMTLRLDAHTVHIGFPNAEQYIDASLNSDQTTNESHALEAVTYTAKLVDKHNILLAAKHNGKVAANESLELSNDGKVIKYSRWSPDSTTDKTILLYEKN